MHTLEKGQNQLQKLAKCFADINIPFKQFGRLAAVLLCAYCSAWHPMQKPRGGRMSYDVQALKKQRGHCWTCGLTNIMQSFLKHIVFGGLVVQPTNSSHVSGLMMQRSFVECGLVLFPQLCVPALCLIIK